MKSPTAVVAIKNFHNPELLEIQSIKLSVTRQKLKTRGPYYFDFGPVVREILFEDISYL